MSATSYRSSGKKTSLSNIGQKDSVGSFRSSHSAKGDAGDWESLHVPVAEDDDHNDEEDEEEEEEEADDMLDTNHSDLDATTPGYSAFARNNMNTHSNLGGPNDWLNLPKIRKKKKKKGSLSPWFRGLLGHFHAQSVIRNWASFFFCFAAKKMTEEEKENEQRMMSTYNITETQFIGKAISLPFMPV